MANAASRKRAVNSLTTKKVTSQIPQTFMVLGGMVLGHYLNEGADGLLAKVLPANAGQQTTQSGMGGVSDTISKYAVPVVLLIAGIVGPEFVKGSYGKYAKSVGIGLSAYGAARGIKEASGKDVLSGGNDNLGLLTVYREPVLDNEFPNPAQLTGTEMSL